MFSLRIVTTDHYMSSPLSGLDVQYSDLRVSEVRRVPVVRVFGSTPAGQKTCMHIHGVFPYLYVPYDGTAPWDRYLRQFATSLDKAINVAQGQGQSNQQHVYKIVLVSGMSMYGYHDKDQQFLKIYMYNPQIIRKAADLLLGGAVMNKPFQPHESHIPYTLQLFIDYNLYGMNMINAAAVKFRRKIENENEKRLKYRVKERVNNRGSNEGLGSDPKSPTSAPSLLNRKSSLVPAAQYWDYENIPSDMLLDGDVERQSVCELEVDIVAADIINRLEVNSNVGANPGLAALWEDERQRGKQRGESVVNITPPQSQALLAKRQKSLCDERIGIEAADSEKILRERLKQIIQDLQPYMDSQSDSEMETSQEDIIPSTQASQLDLHLSQDDKGGSQDTISLDLEDNEEEVPIINEASVKHVVARSQSFCETKTDLQSVTSQDKSLVDILASLAEDSNDALSQQAIVQAVALEDHDSMLAQTARPRDRELDQLEEEEIVEMSQTIWDGDDRSKEYDLEGMDDTWNESLDIKPGTSKDVPPEESDSDSDSDIIPQFDGPGDEKSPRRDVKEMVTKRLGMRGPVYNMGEREYGMMGENYGQFSAPMGNYTGYPATQQASMNMAPISQRYPMMSSQQNLSWSSGPMYSQQPPHGQIHQAQRDPGMLQLSPGRMHQSPGSMQHQGSRVQHPPGSMHHQGGTMNHSPGAIHQMQSAGIHSSHDMSPSAANPFNDQAMSMYPGGDQAGFMHHGDGRMKERDMYGHQMAQYGNRPMMSSMSQSSYVPNYQTSKQNLMRMEQSAQENNQLNQSQAQQNQMSRNSSLYQQHQQGFSNQRRHSQLPTSANQPFPNPNQSHHLQSSNQYHMSGQLGPNFDGMNIHGARQHGIIRQDPGGVKITGTPASQPQTNYESLRYKHTIRPQQQSQQPSGGGYQAGFQDKPMFSHRSTGSQSPRSTNQSPASDTGISSKVNPQGTTGFVLKRPQSKGPSTGDTVSSKMGASPTTDLGFGDIGVYSSYAQQMPIQGDKGLNQSPVMSGYLPTSTHVPSTYHLTKPVCQNLTSASNFVTNTAQHSSPSPHGLLSPSHLATTGDPLRSLADGQPSVFPIPTSGGPQPSANVNPIVSIDSFHQKKLCYEQISPPSTPSLEKGQTIPIMKPTSLSPVASQPKFDSQLSPLQKLLLEPSASKTAAVQRSHSRNSVSSVSSVSSEKASNQNVISGHQPDSLQSDTRNSFSNMSSPAAKSRSESLSDSRLYNLLATDSDTKSGLDRTPSVSSGNKLNDSQQDLFSDSLLSPSLSRSGNAPDSNIGNDSLASLFSDSFDGDMNVQGQRSIQQSGTKSNMNLQITAENRSLAGNRGDLHKTDSSLSTLESFVGSVTSDTDYGINFSKGGVSSCVQQDNSSMMSGQLSGQSDQSFLSQLSSNDLSDLGSFTGQFPPYPDAQALQHQNTSNYNISNWPEQPQYPNKSPKRSDGGPPRKRGRPPKNSLTTSGMSVVSAVPGEKKRRGRPRKNSVALSTAQPNTTSPSQNVQKQFPPFQQEMVGFLDVNSSQQHFQHSAIKQQQQSPLEQQQKMQYQSNQNFFQQPISQTENTMNVQPNTNPVGSYNSGFTFMQNQPFQSLNQPDPDFNQFVSAESQQQFMQQQNQHIQQQQQQQHIQQQQQHIQQQQQQNQHIQQQQQQQQQNQHIQQQQQQNQHIQQQQQQNQHIQQQQQQHYDQSFLSANYMQQPQGLKQDHLSNQGPFLSQSSGSMSTIDASQLFPEEPQEQQQLLNLDSLSETAKPQDRSQKTSQEVSNQEQDFQLTTLQSMKLPNTLVQNNAMDYTPGNDSLSEMWYIPLRRPFPSPAYTYKFHLPRPFSKKLKVSEPNGASLDVVRMHPKDARKYSLLKIGKEAIRLKRLSPDMIEHIKEEIGKGAIVQGIPPPIRNVHNQTFRDAGQRSIKPTTGTILQREQFQDAVLGNFQPQLRNVHQRDSIHGVQVTSIERYQSPMNNGPSEYPTTTHNPIIADLLSCDNPKQGNVIESALVDIAIQSSIQGVCVENPSVMTVQHVAKPMIANSEPKLNQKPERDMKRQRRISEAKERRKTMFKNKNIANIPHLKKYRAGFSYFGKGHVGRGGGHVKVRQIHPVLGPEFEDDSSVVLKDVSLNDGVLTPIKSRTPVASRSPAHASGHSMSELDSQEKEELESKLKSLYELDLQQPQNNQMFHEEEMFVGENEENSEDEYNSSENVSDDFDGCVKPNVTNTLSEKEGIHKQSKKDIENKENVYVESVKTNTQVSNESKVIVNLDSEPSKTKDIKQHSESRTDDSSVKNVKDNTDVNQVESKIVSKSEENNATDMIIDAAEVKHENIESNSESLQDVEEVSSSINVAHEKSDSEVRKDSTDTNKTNDNISNEMKNSDQNVTFYGKFKNHFKEKFAQLKNSEKIDVNKKECSLNSDNLKQLQSDSNKLPLTRSRSSSCDSTYETSLCGSRRSSAAQSVESALLSSESSAISCSKQNGSDEKKVKRTKRKSKSISSGSRKSSSSRSSSVDTDTRKKFKCSWNGKRKPYNVDSDSDGVPGVDYIVTGKFKGYKEMKVKVKRIDIDNAIEVVNVNSLSKHVELDRNGFNLKVDSLKNGDNTQTVAMRQEKSTTGFSAEFEKFIASQSTLSANEKETTSNGGVDEMELTNDNEDPSGKFKANVSKNTDTSVQMNRSKNTDTPVQMDLSRNTDTSVQMNRSENTDTTVKMDGSENTDTSVKMDGSENTDTNVKMDGSENTDTNVKMDGSENTDTNVKMDGSENADTPIKMDGSENTSEMTHLKDESLTESVEKSCNIESSSEHLERKLKNDEGIPNDNCETEEKVDVTDKTQIGESQLKSLPSSCVNACICSVKVDNFQLVSTKETELKDFSSTSEEENDMPEEKPKKKLEQPVKRYTDVKRKKKSSHRLANAFCGSKARKKRPHRKKTFKWMSTLNALHDATMEKLTAHKVYDSVVVLGNSPLKGKDNIETRTQPTIILGPDFEVYCDRAVDYDDNYTDTLFRLAYYSPPSSDNGNNSSPQPLSPVEMKPVTSESEHVKPDVLIEHREQKMTFADVMKSVRNSGEKDAKQFDEIRLSNVSDADESSTEPGIKTAVAKEAPMTLKDIKSYCLEEEEQRKKMEFSSPPDLGPPVIQKYFSEDEGQGDLNAPPHLTPNRQLSIDFKCDLESPVVHELSSPNLQQEPFDERNRNQPPFLTPCRSPRIPLSPRGSPRLSSISDVTKPDSGGGCGGGYFSQPVDSADTDTKVKPGKSPGASSSTGSINVIHSEQFSDISEDEEDGDMDTSPLIAPQNQKCAIMDSSQCAQHSDKRHRNNKEFGERVERSDLNRNNIFDILSCPNGGLTTDNEDAIKRPKKECSSREQFVRNVELVLNKDTGVVKDCSKLNGITDSVAHRQCSMKERVIAYNLKRSQSLSNDTDLNPLVKHSHDNFRRGLFDSYHVGSDFWNTGSNSQPQSGFNKSYDQSVGFSNNPLNALVDLHNNHFPQNSDLHNTQFSPKWNCFQGVHNFTPQNDKEVKSIMSSNSVDLFDSSSDPSSRNNSRSQLIYSRSLSESNKYDYSIVPSMKLNSSIIKSVENHMYNRERSRSSSRDHSMENDILTLPEDKGGTRKQANKSHIQTSQSNSSHLNTSQTDSSNEQQSSAHGDEDETQSKGEDLFTKKLSSSLNGSVIMPLIPPPSRENIQHSLSQFGLTAMQSMGPFYGNYTDVPYKPREGGGQVLKVPSALVKDLEDFTHTSTVTGLKIWRMLFCVNDNVLTSQSDSNISDVEQLEKLPQLKYALTGDRPVVICPFKSPPSSKDVVRWGKGKKMYKDFKNQAIQKERHKKCIETETNVEEKVPVEKRNKESNVSATYCVKQKGMEGKKGKKLRLNLFTGRRELYSSDSQPSQTGSRTKGQGSSATSPDNQPELDIDMDISLTGLPKLDTQTETPMTGTPTQTESPVTCTPKYKEEDDGFLHSTPLLRRQSTDLFEPECTPIVEDRRPVDVGMSEQDQFVTPKRIKPLQSRRSWANSDKSLHQDFMNTQLKGQFVSPQTLQDEVSQIEGPSLKNSFGFKLSQQNYQTAKTLHEFQHLTVLSVEVHADSRGDLKPDPEIDVIHAIFYAIFNDVPSDENTRFQTGVFILDPESANLQGHDKLSTNENQRQGAGSLSEDSKLRTLLHKSGVFDLKVTYFKMELEMLQQFKEFITEWDPDILVGYEIQVLSWGYILQRASALSYNLTQAISRVPGFKQSSHHSAERDEWGADHHTEIHVAGRIVLNLWRILRHEVTLNIYSFENVAFHVLHRRIPLHTFKSLTSWFNNKTHLHRWKVVNHYVTRVKGALDIMDKLDLVGRTSEFARVFGIEFYHVLSRGSQYRVESMMLRVAKPLNYIPVSPSVHQRARMKSPECIQLTLEPESRFYTDPVIVLDFQSLYPSIMIAYNYCFSTCLGRMEWFHNLQDGPLEFGCTSLNLTPTIIKNLKEDVTISPNGIVFCKQSVKRGVLPLMVEEILNTRLMVKNAMSSYKDDKTLTRLLHARQMGLKLIANVTYGYTAANFSGRMPCIEVGDSIVRKAREALERSIKLVEETPKWGAKVIYGDTDSMFLLLKGKSKDEAFKVGYDIAKTVTKMFPKPIKLKFEKVYLPCVLQTKKRYCGFMYETPDQKEPVFDAKGIETVRRDSCSAVSKMLERSIKILFTSKDVSQVKSYIQQQCKKVMEGTVSLQDFIFAKEYRGMPGYKPGACVPALEISKKLLRHDKRSEPRVGERVPYVIVYGSPGLPLIQLVKQPLELLQDHSLRLNSVYYITKQILPPLNRYHEIPHSAGRVTNQLAGGGGGSKKGTISQYFATSNCPLCDDMTKQPVCSKCMKDPQLVCVTLNDKVRYWERVQCHLDRICKSCTGSPEAVTGKACVSLDCPILYRKARADIDMDKVTAYRNILEKIFKP